MNCSPASSPVAAFVLPASGEVSRPRIGTSGNSGNLLSANSSQPLNSSRTARAIINGAAREHEGSTKTTVNTQAGLADGTANDDATESYETAFADIIQQIAGAASVTQAIPSAGRQQDRLPGLQQTNAISTSEESNTPTEPATTAARQNKKEPAGVAAPASTNPNSGSAPLGKDRQPDVTAFPVDVIVPPTPLALRLSRVAEAGAPPPAQLRMQAAPTAAIEPEAALTVVIGTGETQAAPSQEQPAHQLESPPAGNDTDPATPQSAALPVQGGTVASAGEIATQASSVAINAAPVSLGSSMPGNDSERRKNTIAALAGIAETDAVKPFGPQTGSTQDFQAKAEPTKVADNTQPRNDAQRPAVAAPEPLPTEKTPLQPLRSVALEFTPDGARDVRVRLSERGGEVHVTLHSTDPSVTKNLRAGVTDLATVLANAGYDAKAWTSGRQQQDSSHHAEEPSPQRRNNRLAAGADDFDGVLQQGGLPNNSQENL